MFFLSWGRIPQVTPRKKYPIAHSCEVLPPYFWTPPPNPSREKSHTKLLRQQSTRSGSGRGKNCSCGDGRSSGSSGDHRVNSGGIQGGIGRTVAMVDQTTINQKAAAIVAETLVMVAVAHVEMVVVVVVEAEAAARWWQQKQRRQQQQKHWHQCQWRHKQRQQHWW